MTIRYFQDTDTALFQFNQNEVVETREISENVYSDLDKDGNLVSLTIEHAKDSASLSEVSYQQIEKKVA